MFPARFNIVNSLVFAAPGSDNPRCGIGLEGIVAAKLCHGHLYCLHVGKPELAQGVRQFGSRLEVKCVDDHIDIWVQSGETFEFLFRAGRCN